ncbi:hypothetical protein CC78DRAFT_538448 [Lojkania enalia]|uniref:Rhodopsin domain-containing protein n=1 Tax=Lojkania enalia TaxID=147567 RepID=A0A9P4MWV8_9PLEO|nr:hypothetical protein CC78DRAFT_538448 [Didymosphaeria enalia]
MSFTPEQIAEYLQQSAMDAPVGIVPDFDDPPDMNHEVATAIYLVVSSLVVFMRLYTKVTVLRHFHLEDWILILGYIIDIGGFKVVTFLLETRHHYGTHMYNLRIGAFFQYDHHFYAANVLYFCIICTLKTAIILQLIRLFTPQGVRNGTFWALHVLLWFNVAFYFAAFWVSVFNCVPVRKAWWRDLVDGHCIEIRKFFIVAQTFNCLTDILILVIPQRVIWSFNMSNARKWGLSLLFFIGIAAVVCSAVRIWVCVELFESVDRSLWMANLGNWTEPEIMCGFLVMSLPVLPKFLKSIGATPLLGKIGTSFRSLFTRGSAAHTKTSSGTVVGSEGPSKDKSGDRQLVTDIEFEELVNRTTGTMGVDSPVSDGRQEGIA